MSLSIDQDHQIAHADPSPASSYLEWGPIFGGAVLAAAISSIMTAFGSAVGLSLVSPFPGHGTSLIALAVAAALWALWISVSSFATGGYLAGRMRKPAGDSTHHERDIRDGAHGLVVWAAGALLLAMVTTSTLGGAAKGLLASATAVGAAGVASMNQPSDPVGMIMDRLTRTTQPQGVDERSRQELGRVLLSGVTSGKLNDDDRSYVAAKLAATSGISQQEAQARVDDAMAKLNQAKEDARIAAENARKTSIVTAFLTAAVLLVGAAAAWWSARIGGRHRDEGTDLSHLVRAHRDTTRR